ncbi:uncharacterized protein LOC120677975 [Panicum virgatum]|uniref:uncharacterized protein LOC120677975 n=1 Tax=Panicum virgatum TaxID=38727 RepID=UPI0019D68BDE|nr:uncharacterized protein LOC120677975 [Panicum virgatum]
MAAAPRAGPSRTRGRGRREAAIDAAHAAALLLRGLAIASVAASPPRCAIDAGHAASPPCHREPKPKGAGALGHKSRPFHPPPASAWASSTPPPSNHTSLEAPLPLYTLAAASRKVMPAQGAGAGLKRSKSIAPRPEETLPPPAPSGITADSPRKKSFWSFLHLSSSSGSHRSASSAAAPCNSGGGAVARRNSVSVASASALEGRLEAIAEPESPGRRSEGSSSSSFGRKVARSRSVGCGSRSFGDCALRRVESHREPKPKGAGALGHLGGAHGDDERDQHHSIKCAGFFGGGLGAAPPPSSSYWLSAPNGGTGGGSSRGNRTRSHRRGNGTRSHRSSAWAAADDCNCDCSPLLEPVV